MKILIVSQYFHPENFRLNDVALKLQNRGYKIDVLTGVPNYPSGKLFKNYSWRKKYIDSYFGVKIYRVPLFLRRDSKGWQLALNYLSFMVMASLFGPVLLRKRKYDIVISVNYSPATVGVPGLLMSKIKKTPMIFWVHDLWPQSLMATGAISSPFILNMVAKMMSWIYKKSELIFVQSEAFIDAIKEFDIASNKIKYIPNWAEDLYGPILKIDNQSQIERLPDDGFIVMFAGNLGKAQSLNTIIDAASMASEFKIYWIFIGDGREGQWLAEQIKQRDLSNIVYLLGSKPMESMPQYFSQADALLVSLVPDSLLSKTIPGKLQSYLACGRPLLGSLDGEGARVIIESKSGFVSPAGNAKKLSEIAINMSKLDKGLLKTMSQNSLQYYKSKFDSNMVLDNIEQEMCSLIAKK
jgi:colanic acid biosynthesis glycosyl transferase WcaI